MADLPSTEACELECLGGNSGKHSTRQVKWITRPQLKKLVTNASGAGSNT